MTKGTLSCGFEIEYDEARVKDMRFLDVLAEVEENGLKASKVVEMMLGKKQKEALYKHLEDEDGRVQVEDFMTAFEDLMAILPNSKN